MTGPDSYEFLIGPAQDSHVDHSKSLVDPLEARPPANSYR